MSSHRERFCHEVEAVISFWQSDHPLFIQLESLSDIKVMFFKRSEGNRKFSSNSKTVSSVHEGLMITQVQ